MYDVYFYVTMNDMSFTLSFKIFHGITAKFCETW